MRLSGSFPGRDARLTCGYFAINVRLVGTFALRAPGQMIGINLVECLTSINLFVTAVRDSNRFTYSGMQERSTFLSTKEFFTSTAMENR